MTKQKLILAITVLALIEMIAAYIFSKTQIREVNYFQLVIVVVMFILYQRYRKMDD